MGRLGPVPVSFTAAVDTQITVTAVTTKNASQEDMERLETGALLRAVLRCWTSTYEVGAGMPSTGAVVRCEVDTPPGGELTSTPRRTRSSAMELESSTNRRRKT